MNIVITGANGFIGRNLCKRLIKQGHTIYAIIKEDSEFSQESTPIYSESNIHYINCDMSKFSSLPSLINESIDVFYHFAWAGTAGAGRGDYALQLENCKYSCDVVIAAKQLGAKRIVVPCTINEYETNEYFRMDNISPSIGYIYGAGKMAAHYMSQTIANQQGIEYIPVLVTNIYGPGEESARLINTTIKTLLNNEVPKFTEGKQTYDFIYIDDAINIFDLLATKGKTNTIYYLGSGNPKPLKEYLLTINKIVNPNIKSDFGAIPFTGVDLDYNQFDLKRVVNDLDYTKFVSFEDGITNTMNDIIK